MLLGFLFLMELSIFYIGVNYFFINSVFSSGTNSLTSLLGSTRDNKNNLLIYNFIPASFRIM